MYQPHLATLCKFLKRRNTPYLVTPEGGVDPGVLSKHWIRKFLYNIAIEKPRFLRAAGITAITPAEERFIRAFVPHYKGLVQWIPNPIDLQTEMKIISQSNRGKRIVCLARYDVHHKGLDILVDIARLCPEFQFEIYGSESPRTSHNFQNVKNSAPVNVIFHQPVFSDAKIKVLLDADAYIQTSRYEAFGVSIAESMILGVPCFISKGCSMSELFEEYRLGTVLQMNVTEAAKDLKREIFNIEELQSNANRARAFAIEHFSSTSVASAYIRLYDMICQKTDDSSFNHIEMKS